MIKKPTYTQAALIAKELAEKGLYLTVRPDSVMQCLMDASSSIEQPKTTNMNEAVPSFFTRTLGERADSVEMVTGFDYDTADSMHSREILRAVQEIAPHLRAHISFARNVVAPKVTEYKEKLIAYAQNNRPTDPASLFSIEKREVPAILEDEYFMSDELERITMTKTSSQSLQFSIKGSTEDEFYLGLVRCSSDRLNELIGRWLEDKPEYFLRAVFERNFGVRENSFGIDEKEFDQYLLNFWGVRNQYCSMDVALAVYLMAKRLIASPQETVTSVSGAAYKQQLSDLSVDAGITLMNSLRRVRQMLEGKILICEQDPQGRKVVVNAPVYAQYLQGGGTPEALLGLLVSGEKQYNSDIILAQRTELEKRWVNYSFFEQSSQQKAYMQGYREYAMNLAVRGLEELEDAEVDFGVNVVQHKDMVSKKIRDYFDRLDKNWYDDLGQVARDVIAGCRFFFTGSYEILDEMAQAAKHNPDIDPHEAASLAVLKYYASWIIPQLAVQR